MTSLPSYKYLVGDCREVLRTLPAGSVHCVVTSPPYWGLRDYKVPPSVWDGTPDCAHEWGTEERAKRKDYLPKGESTAQARSGTDDTQGIGPMSGGRFCTKCGAWLGVLGNEPTVDLYVAHLVEVFQEIRRVLRQDGTAWLNIGDSYAGSGSPGGDFRPGGMARGGDTYKRPYDRQGATLKDKDLCMVPFRVAIALQADGWWVRADVCWNKPSCKPEPVQDRPVKVHEYVFLLSRSQDYFYDAEAVKEPMAEYELKRRQREHAQGLKSFYNLASDGKTGLADPSKGSQLRNAAARGVQAASSGMRNLRSVWTISTASFEGAHFAVFPMELVEVCIKAGTSEHGCCPKCGAQWTRVVVCRSNYNAREPAHMPRNTATKVDSTGWASPSITTKGWRPDCDCYGLTIIKDPLRYPVLKMGETDDDHAERLAKYEIAMADWSKRWAELAPKYGACETTPAVVLDPFAGSGTTLEAARGLGRSAIGIDLSPEYRKLAVGRDALMPVIDGYGGDLDAH